MGLTICQGDARAPYAGPADGDRLAVDVRRRGARPRLRHRRRRLQRFFNDPVGFKAECEQGRDLGLDGKTLIHPNQIDVCKRDLRAVPGRDRDRARDHRRLRAARELRPRRDPARRQDGRVACTPTWRAGRSPSPKGSKRSPPARDPARGLPAPTSCQPEPIWTHRKTSGVGAELCRTKPSVPSNLRACESDQKRPRDGREQPQGLTSRPFRVAPGAAGAGGGDNE